MPIGLLLGGPGTGKSHITAYLLREVIAEFGQSSILACAPTGKAAVRMTQAFSLAGIDLTATTIHRTLEIGRNGHDGDGWGFMRNRFNPLDAKFIVADESSMDDCDLLADLLDAVPNAGHILLIGDPYQLPPVGHGAPLRDLIAAGVPHGELTEVRRNAGQIVHACVRIKNGESFDVSTNIDLDADPSRNVQFIHAKDDKAACDALVNTLKTMTRFHPVWQTQVIVARNKAGDVSRKALNELLQPLLNPDGLSVAGNQFKVGDKIICTKNSKMHRVEPIYSRGIQAEDAQSYDVVRDPDNNPEEVYVANGEIGRVVAIAAKLTIARFSEGEYLVKIPMGRQKDDDEEGGEDSSGRGCNFDHAYAVTCHRMQGSEVPCAITIGDEQGGMIANREWIYTAMSRPSKLNILIGKMSTFDKMRSRVALNKRKTFLSDLVFNVLTEDV
jgi:ATP-dependent exoDNAse (exonuclease V) alpha subunit